MSKRLITSFLLAFLSFIGGAHATLLPGQANALTFNFDFTGQTPAPPYGGVGFTFSGLSSPSSDDKVAFDVFSGSSGSGTLVCSRGLLKPLVGDAWGDTGSGCSGAALPDGIFSLQFYVTSGDVDFAGTVSAFGYTDGVGQTSPVLGILATNNSVPEPEGLGLVGLGLAALAFSRRRSGR